MEKGDSLLGFPFHEVVEAPPDTWMQASFQFRGCGRENRLKFTGRIAFPEAAVRKPRCEGSFLCRNLSQILKAKAEGFEGVSSLRKTSQRVGMPGILIKDSVHADLGFRLEHPPQNGRGNVDAMRLCPHQPAMSRSAGCPVRGGLARGRMTNDEACSMERRGANGRELEIRDRRICDRSCTVDEPMHFDFSIRYGNEFPRLLHTLGILLGPDPKDQNAAVTVCEGAERLRQSFFGVGSIVKYREIEVFAFLLDAEHRGQSRVSLLARSAEVLPEIMGKGVSSHFATRGCFRCVFIELCPIFAPETRISFRDLCRGRGFDRRPGAPMLFLCICA